MRRLPAHARRDLQAIGKALEGIKALVPKQDAGEFKSLLARIDGLSVQLHAVNELLAVMVRAARRDEGDT